ncbi:helix-turn-helix domain-containing protein [Hymenobacter aranciens]|uniref:helix-turn-helix domain-containing protein n=1 Tax=Hymenobacter aranciens TaxID=3063996 RepID=UPI00350FD44C
MRAIAAWLRCCWCVNYSVSGLTELLHRLGFSYKLTPPMPCEADPVRQATKNRP